MMLLSLNKVVIIPFMTLCIALASCQLRDTFDHRYPLPPVLGRNSPLPVYRYGVSTPPPNKNVFLSPGQSFSTRTGQALYARSV